MELYNVPEGSYVRILPQKQEEPYSKLQYGEQIDLETAIAQVEWENGNRKEDVRIPPDAPNVTESEVIKFSHVDGMYSLCYKLNEHYETTGACNIAAWTEVEIVELDDIFGFDKIRQIIGRAGYGKDGKGEYRQAALKDMSDEWVKASIEFVPKDHPHRRFYQDELVYRQLMNISIPDEDA